MKGQTEWLIVVRTPAGQLRVHGAKAVPVLLAIALLLYVGGGLSAEQVLEAVEHLARSVS